MTRIFIKNCCVKATLECLTEASSKKTGEFWVSSYKMRSKITFIFINKYSVTYPKCGQ